MSWKVVREDLEEKVEPVISDEMPWHKFWYIKSKNIIVVMSEVNLDVNWKIV